MRSRLAALLGASTLLLGPVARADDIAAAEALFNAGLDEMRAGRYDTACGRLAESHRLDPRPGTLFTTAECEAQAGKLASALARYKDYMALFARLPPADQARQRGREQVAQKAISELGPKVPRLTLKLPAGAPKSATVRRNDTEVGAASIGLALPVDPGEHVLVVQVGQARSEQRVALAVGESRELTLQLPSSDTSPASARRDAPAVAAGPEQDAGPQSSSNTLAYVVGGVGVAGVLVGSVTGALVFSKKSTIADHCRGVDCDQQGLDAADSAKTLGLVSTIGFGVGVAGLATATVLLLSGSKERASPGVSASVVARGRGAELGLRGVF